MKMKELFGKTIEGGISLVNDPFKQSCINAIHIHAIKDVFDGYFTFSGKVEFAHGNTGGRQEFTGKNLADVYNQIAEFCMTLK